MKRMTNKERDKRIVEHLDQEEMNLILACIIIILVVIGIATRNVEFLNIHHFNYKITSICLGLFMFIAHKFKWTVFVPQRRYIIITEYHPAQLILPGIAVVILLFI